MERDGDKGNNTRVFSLDRAVGEEQPFHSAPRSAFRQPKMRKPHEYEQIKICRLPCAGCRRRFGGLAVYAAL